MGVGREGGGETRPRAQRTRRTQQAQAPAATLVLQALPDAAVAIDTEFRVISWNPAATRVLGWQVEEMLGADIRRLIPPDNWASFQGVAAKLAAGEEVPPYDSERLDAQGRRHPCVVHGAALRDGDRLVGYCAVIRESTERQGQERQLASLLSSVPVVVACFDSSSAVTYAAGGALAATGLQVGDLLLEVFDRATPLHEAVRLALEGESAELRTWFGDRLWQWHVGPLPEGTEHAGADGSPGAFLTATDVTEESRVRERLSDVLSAAPVGITGFDAQGRITHASGSAYTLAGVDPVTTIGKPFVDLYADNPDLVEGALACLRGEETEVVTEFGNHLWRLRFRPTLGADGQVRGGVLVAHEASSWILPEPADEQDGALPHPLLLEYLDRDEVTGLPGRRALQKRLAQPAPAVTQRAVAVLNVDGFALVNEAYGAGAGDGLLRSLAERLAEQRDDALLGRWHADEFVLLLEGDDAAGRLSEVVDRLLAAAREPFDVPTTGTSLSLSLSAGVAATDEVAARDLLPAAHRALAAARQRGRDRAERYDRQMVVMADASLARELRQAIDSDQLVLHYQPIVALGSNRVAGLEALVRWEHPGRGLLMPGEFIDMAERTGQVGALGDRVLQEACRTARALVADELVGSLSVNLSARQLAYPALVAQVAEALERTGCPPQALLLEVTETAVMADLESAVRTMEALKEIGVRLALDDFGTGYSSLLYLKHFPVDELKVDRSFVAGLGSSANDSAIVAATVSLGRTMGIGVVAEGVETVRQLGLLSRMGCDFGQGYHFSPALPLDALRSWLAGRTRRPAGRGTSSGEPPAAVAQILRMHAVGASPHTIAAALNTQRHRTSRGTRWSAQAVALVIAGARLPGLDPAGEDPPAQW